jgi:ATP-binding cassette, subfamily F, member 3
MKILAGRLPLVEGQRKEGHNVIVSYFSQDQDDLLSSDKTVWDEVYSVAPNHIVPQLRTLLGCFLFSGDSIEKPVSVLSGGERSRLVLCKLLLSPANCLLLDEPTNHLDIRSKDMLMDSLQDYEGTIVFVSHDRYFLDGLATKVLEVGNQTAIPYLGNYEEYLLKKDAEKQEIQSEQPAAAAAPISQSEQDSAPGKKKKTNPIKIQQVKNQIEQIEGQIHLLETRVAVLTEMLATEALYRDHQLFRSTMDEHDRLQEELNRLMEKWEQFHAELKSYT